MFSYITQTNIRPTWFILTAVGALFMFMPIGIQFIGEESVYAVYLQNMMQTGDYINAFYRPPLFLWVATALDGLLNFSSIELPLRVTSILSSLAAAAFAALFAHKVFQKENAGIVAALVFLTLGEIQFWYGWLGYADAMFLFFIFSSTICIWLAAQFRKVHWYALAVLLINCAFFTKALTAYLFFASTLVIVAYAFQSWRFFLRPINLFLTMAIMAAPLAWAQMHGSSANATSASLVHDIAMRFTEIDPLRYLKHIILYPVEFLARMMPLSLLVLWYVVKRRSDTQERTIRLILLILLVNFLPYWFAPFSSMRHVVPLYSWASLALTYWLLQFDFEIQKKAAVAIMVVLLLKIPFSLWGLPLLKEKGDDRAFMPVAVDVLQQIDSAIIRQSAVSFVGFSITAYLNEMRHPQPNINFLQPDEHGVYVLAYEPKEGAKMVKKYTLFNSPLYLLYIE